MSERTSGLARSFKNNGFTSRQAGGFTIIETIIVLAIAGFIMVIVFFAVPTLRANSHNNSRRNDAARLAALVNDFIITNSGSLPAQFGTVPGQLDITDERWAIVDPPQNSSINTFPTPNYGSLSTIIVNLGFSCQSNTLTYVGGPVFAIGFTTESITSTQTSCLQG